MQVDRFPGLFHHFSVDSFKLLAPLFATHSKHTQNKQTNKQTNIYVVYYCHFQIDAEKALKCNGKTTTTRLKENKITG